MGGMAVGIISAVISAAGQYASSRSQSASYAAQAEAEKNNAAIAGINADIAQGEAKRQQAISAENAYKSKGRMRAALAESGTLESASSILLQDQADAEANEEQLRIARAGEMEALNHKIQQSNALNSSSILANNSKASKTGGILSSVGTLIGGAADAYNYNRLYKQGNNQGSK